MQVLTGNDHLKAQGSWVREKQGVASEHGFNAVSQYWYPQTMSFEDGINKIKSGQRSRLDLTFDMRNVKFHIDNGKLEVDFDGRRVTPTGHAARQLCNWYKVPQTLWVAYNQGDVGDLGVIKFALENGRRKATEKGPKELLFRTYEDNTLRGVMSSSYDIVDNAWYLEVLHTMIPGGRLSHFNFANEDTIFGNILIPDTIREESDSDYGGMLSIGNCEIGKRTIFQTPSIFRAICMNGCIWGHDKGVELRRKHIRIDYTELVQAIADNINRQIPLLTIGVDSLMKCRMLKATAGIAHLFAQVAKDGGFGHEFTDTALKEWRDNCGGEKTAFTVIDGITRAGQKFDADTWYKADRFAGSILNGGSDGWNKINTKARMIDDITLAKAYGIAV